MHGWIAAVLNLLGMGGGTAAAATPAEPGGVFRRLGDLGRLFRRRGDLARVFRGYDRMADAIQYDTRVKDASEVIQYVFDFSRFPEVVAGGTLTSPTIDASSPAGLTLSSATVTDADETVDSSGTVVKAGKGLKVAVSGGTAGETYMLETRATVGVATRVVKGRVVVE